MCDLERIEQLLSDEEEEDYETAMRLNHTRLTECVDLKELLETNTAQFQVQNNEDAALEEQNTYYKQDENLLKNINLHCLGPVEEDLDENSGTSFSPGETPFSSLAARMFNVTEDGKVKKRILSEGFGEVVPSEALVWIHYNLYLEFSEVPFDSSYLRGHTTRLRLGLGMCFTGLDIAISTMKKDEKAQFLVHHDYAFGTLGVAPRIPPESEILIHIELKKFVDNALAMKMGESTEEELQNLSFEEIYKGAQGLTFQGNTFFNQKKWPLAIQMYRNAVRCMEKCDKPGPDEDEKHKILLVKLYGNIAVCYNKFSQPRQAIVACQCALYLNANHPKALYQLALAHLTLSSYDQARKYAFLARKHAPHNPDVNTLLIKIENKERAYKQSTISFARNMFSFSKKEDNCQKTETEETKKEEGKSSDSDIQNLNSLTESTEKLTLTSKEDVPIPSDNESGKVSDEQQKLQPSEESSLEDDYSNECASGTNFELEVIGYIEDFINDPRERRLPMPFGLTYEELKFVNCQARNYGLFWEEAEEKGQRVQYLVK